MNPLELTRAGTLGDVRLGILDESLTILWSRNQRRRNRLRNAENACPRERAISIRGRDFTEGSSEDDPGISFLLSTSKSLLGRWKVIRNAITNIRSRKPARSPSRIKNIGRIKLMDRPLYQRVKYPAKTASRRTNGGGKGVVFPPSFCFENEYVGRFSIQEYRRYFRQGIWSIFFHLSTSPCLALSLLVAKVIYRATYEAARLLRILSTSTTCA